MPRIPKELKKGELTTKDMSTTREADSAKAQSEQTSAEVRDYSLQHNVRLEWDLNDDAIADKMCRLLVDDYEVIVDSEELMRLLRWV